jgi:site-specific DNA-cytosine methylase
MPEDKRIFLKDIMHEQTSEYVKVSKKGTYKKFQDKASCLTGGGNSGGNHSDMDLIGIDRNRCFHIGEAIGINGHDLLKRVYADYGKSPTVTTITGGNQYSEIACGAQRGRYLIDGVRQDGKMLTAGKTKQYMEVRGDGKTNTLTTVSKDNNIVYNSECAGRYEVEDLIWRRLTPIECERLQTVPDNYTNHVSNSQRYKMLGNGFTVDVIAHILKGMLIR